MLPKVIGFVGTGAIAEAVVRGMCTSPSLSSPPQILLSPRSASRSAALATEFKTCAVASTNQEVVDKCDLVVVALLAQNASTALKELSFRPGQQIVSLIPFGLLDIRPLVGPATNVVFALPMPSVAIHLGPVAMFPPNKLVAEMFAHIGVPVELADEKEMSAITPATALMAPYYKLLGTTTNWITSKGVRKEAASKFVGSLFHALTVDALKVGGDGYDELTEECQTKGGLNEQALNDLNKSGAFDHWTEALEGIRTRLA
mmetsp:Transcript_15685/g.30243  ORF Transcript_15685/g.30243 Transcript_15685/m.30243 type:complete len:259 (-) Transcript_15685:77-853(-)|eukprot:CAMPEP_0114233210 /NCGR_PEP_ID=MMETSP0058-20121206/5034_1 /TAXON_ID=36894 /ORGANISM="Pyramimonas parkeae, CCMP726" /LENGTH=258 /DNA_ID=CAMNT_0001344767 /DNA_START=27 /DNA_END=803 /DNA_ORIENTATION=+